MLALGGSGGGCEAGGCSLLALTFAVLDCGWEEVLAVTLGCPFPLLRTACKSDPDKVSNRAASVLTLSPDATLLGIVGPSCSCIFSAIDSSLRCLARASTPPPLSTVEKRLKNFFISNSQNGISLVLAPFP